MFGSQYVTADDGAYVFGSYAVGAVHAPAEALTFAPLCHIAMRRMKQAYRVMIHSMETADTGLPILEAEMKPTP